MRKPRNRRKAPVRGAFGGPKKVQRRLDFLQESSRQGLRVANDRALKKAYAEFYATPAGKKFAKEFGKSTVDCAPRRTNRAPTVDFHDPADLPDSVGCGSHNGRKIVRAGHHPVDDMEPEMPCTQIEGLTDDEIHGSSEIFGLALRWALDADEIVARGRRSMVMISEMRPDLGRGFIPDTKAVLKSFHNALRASHAALEKCGFIFARYLEWMRRSGTVSGIGERLDLTAYVLRPDLLTANTLAKLGALVGKTRQAKDKLANCQRDTFSGIKALPMRADITRDRCRASQLAIG
jgi:hypothetical protein